VLRQRIITAIVMAVVVLAAIFTLPSPWFAGFVTVVVAVGLWEFSNFAALRSVPGRMAYCIASLAVLAVMGWGTAVWATPHVEAIGQVLILAGIWWCLASALVVSYPATGAYWNSVWQRAAMGWLTLLPAWLAFIWLHAQADGAWLLLFVVALVASADIGAFFAGTRYGHRKLAPRVSPGKSWEGLAGGLASSFVLVLLVWVLFWRERFALPQLLGVAAVTVVASVFGDLFESMLKRERGVKDSSALLPGHGGFMDRLDSLSAAVPVFALGLLFALK
jgi:phosphatidate cytidylyltransferase